MSLNSYGGSLCQARAQYTTFEDGKLKLAIYERYLAEDGTLVEEVWEREAVPGLGNGTAWLRNQEPSERDLRAVRWLLDEGRGHGGWNARIEEVMYVMTSNCDGIVADWQMTDLDILEPVVKSNSDLARTCLKNTLNRLIAGAYYALRLLPKPLLGADNSRRSREVAL